MPTLESIVGGTPKKIEYSIKVAKGIYAVNDDKQAKANCKTLDIQFDPTLGDNMLQNRVSKFEKFSILTLKAVDRYLQFILFYSAFEWEVNDFANQYPEPTANLIKLASKPFGFQP